MKALLSLAVLVGALTAAANSQTVTFEDVKDKIVIVQCDDSTGSGFVCEMEGKKYFVTNKHIIRGQQRVAAYFSDGSALKFGSMEISRDADMVRFAVASNHPALKIAADDPDRNENVRLFRCSHGGGTCAEIKGRILSVADMELELSAGFQQADSGSALVNSKGEVLGAATYKVKDFNPADWIRTDARGAKFRRFALRLNGHKWVKSDLATYCRKAKAEDRKIKEKFGIYPQTRAAFKSPAMRVNRHKTDGAAKYFINGNIVLALSDVKGVKNPVVRVVALVEGVRMAVLDAVTDEPGGKYEFCNVPVYAYGMPKSNYAFNIGNGICAYYLEGMAFYQPPVKMDAIPGGGKNIPYFDRSMLLSGGFRIQDRIAGGRPPKIVAFRLECWQNGSLAGVYDSMRPDTLNSKGIPVDWFVVGRYPEKFLYVDKCRYERY